MHKNSVLLCNASNLNLTYHYLIAKVVCDSQSKHCMIHCANCPGKNQLKAYLRENFELLHEHEHLCKIDTTNLFTEQILLHKHYLMMILLNFW